MSSPDYSRYDVRVIIKFMTALQTPPVDIHTQMLKVMGEECPSIQTVRKWVREFQDGRTNCSDLQRDGRPVSVITEEKINDVRALIQQDRRITVDQMATELDISHGTAWHIVTENLGMKKLCTRWIPHVLTEEQKNKRMLVSSQHLRRFRRDPSFLNRIVAADESWAHSWEPELKRQSAEWRLPEEGRPMKAKRSQGGMKVLHVSFFDRCGVILDWPVPHGTTVNGDYYQWILREKLRPALRRRRQDLLTEGVILLHDNARPHLKTSVVEMLAKWKWEVLAHPPYSPDLSPCDFYLFSAIKEELRGRRFRTEEEINAAWRTSIRNLDTDAIERGITRLPQLWQKCVDANGAYFES